ncbi:hypothetical protein THARTR1_06272 [Trichoderma harzianum]|uniref:Uncharacterized protein n=1 Tax=Trichoderma harzianum TaxID=5544 RepID=A0A2K0U5J8_TRIHA|nr:hypothetical protein THARTR1_06272 [Trichoderma harzianum]
MRLINDPMFSTEFLITNKGLRIDSDLFPVSDRIFFMDMNCVDFAPSATSNSRRHIGILIKFHGGNPLHGILVFLPKHVNPSRSLYLEALFSYPFVFRRGVSPPTQAFLSTPLSYVPEDRVGHSPT